MKVGILGLPNVGKSTLFNAITKSKEAECANYLFCTIEPNKGIIPVPDERLNKLSEFYNSKKTIPANIEIVDIAGLVKGASNGKGRGNQFLSNLREVDAIIHVIRCFDNNDIIHVDETVDPIRDIETINLELIISDIETAKKREEKLKKTAKNGDKYAIEELEKVQLAYAALDKNLPAYTAIGFDSNSEFLTQKPVIYCCNINENELGETDNKYVKDVKNYLKNLDCEILTLCAEFEKELSSLPDDEKTDFVKSYNLKSCGVDELIRSGYKTLGLISFFTAGEKESRAWTIKEGSNAPQAAGKIHSDFERGFIRAETISYDDFFSCGGYNEAKEKGKLRIEGKDYIVKDGDIMLFRFNV